ncbi:hypothetical protein AADZ86_16050 [Colwelliaceae bacterium BS250]
MEAEDRATQDAKAENNYLLNFMPCIYPFFLMKKYDYMDVEVRSTQDAKAEIT